MKLINRLLALFFPPVAEDARARHQSDAEAHRRACEAQVRTLAAQCELLRALEASGIPANPVLHFAPTVAQQVSFLGPAPQEAARLCLPVAQKIARRHGVQADGPSDGPEGRCDPPVAWISFDVPGVRFPHNP